MKLLKIRNCSAIAVVAIASLLCSETYAQQTWNPDYSLSCSERGGCRHADDSLELIPYGQGYGYENEIGSARIPYRDSMRTPYQYRGGSLDSGSGSCGYGGNCGRSHANQRSDRSRYSKFSGRCPYEREQYEQAAYDPRFRYDGSSPSGGYGGREYGNGQGSNSDPNYSIPKRRNFDNYSQAPADRRPELLSIPSLERENSFGRNERHPQANPLNAPPTSTQIIPPPELPPQPLASNSRSPNRQLLPPTNFPSSRNSGQSHTGHDHSGHDHSGHNH